MAAIPPSITVPSTSTEFPLHFTNASETWTIRYENGQLIIISNGSPNVLGKDGDHFPTVLDNLQAWCNNDDDIDIFYCFQQSHGFGMCSPGCTSGATFSMTPDFIRGAFEQLNSGW
eukprot:TRINITY_DN7481_c0_g1_i2.p1 TRINITY_DN7481_c0_g1~~TRINITY_DN7481_c0_g1_i2.p1  ORF type:complete len:116 (-),score=12.87 TRINITY_DN7481_c0_g1_i2:13-360(-)